MNLLHMNYFIAVVEHQSISRAAQSLFITQQTLSSHIASMEKELGTCLFERRPRFRLTRTGERFYQYCVRFRELNESEAAARAESTGPHWILQENTAWRPAAGARWEDPLICAEGHCGY